MGDSTVETSDRDLAKADRKVNSSSSDDIQQTDGEAKNERSPSRPKDVESHYNWLHGTELVMVTAGLTLVTLLFMLDVSIVSTVNEMCHLPYYGL